MTTFMSGNVWNQLKSVAQVSQVPADVAVAYFGKGAARLLPLPAGSRLVVDASENAVKSGQTHPEDLITMIKRGVKIYSVANLHAKVFVIGRTAYIGSNNVSNHSASRLIEAVVSTTDFMAVLKAKEFIQSLCLSEIGPEELKILQKKYRPPKLGNGTPKPRRIEKGPVKLEIGRVMLAQLVLGDRPEESWSTYEAGLKEAKKHQKHPKSHVIEDFWWTGWHTFQTGDTIIQIVDEGNHQVMVSPPGKLIYMRKWRHGNNESTFMYIETPNRKRISLNRLVIKLGKGSKEKLLRRGRASADFASRLLNALK